MTVSTDGDDQKASLSVWVVVVSPNYVNSEIKAANKKLLLVPKSHS